MTPKKLSLIVAGAAILISCSNSGGRGSGGSSTDSAKPMIIEKINVENTKDKKEFSMAVHFSATQDLNGWKLSLYMPFTFKKEGIWNPNLKLEICEDSNQGLLSCGALLYTQNDTNDDSAGWTTVFSVAKDSPYFHLKSGSHYVIVTQNNNLGRVLNYSSYPQSFFAIIDNKVVNLDPTTPANYYVNDYMQSAIDAENKGHVDTIWSNSSTAAATNTIVPTPAKYQKLSDASYKLANGVVIHNTLADNGSNGVSTFYKNALMTDLKISASIDNSTATSGIIIKQIGNPEDINNNPEGYKLTVSNESITVEVMNNAGAFYALQSLRQLWLNQPTLQGVEVADYPRFKYRGMGLDTARHFFSVSEIESVIDLMAFHKLNTLHIHFADDEGFRIGIPSYPQLSSIGDKRGYGNNWGDNLIAAQVFKQANLDLISGITNPSLYSTATDFYTGTYSPADLSGLIQYANARQITVIPEIDIPGHARALVKSLPNAFVDPNDKSKFASVQGFSDDVIPVCTYNTDISIGNEFTQTINDIVNQIATQFNNQNTVYAIPNEVSVGGDEVSGTAWSNDSSCQGY